MALTPDYTFRRATPADLDLLLDWQTRPHVRAWWDEPEPDTPMQFEDTRVARWIVCLDGRAFAYMQDYTVHGWEGHHFYHLPKGSRGIDQYIGEASMIAKGHGPAFIRQRLDTLFSEGAPVVATDPDPANVHAIAAYRKAGFSVFGPPQDTKWGRILPMKIVDTARTW